jgi:mono/diheme cytochrome c family protein
MMKTKLLNLIVMAGLLLTGSAIVNAAPGVAPVDNKLYAEECGTCHFAYQPGLLPARSWKKIMAGLEDHFGENSELEDADRATLEAYLTTNAGDHSDYKRSKKLMRSIKSGATPLRISEIPYFVKKHREVPKGALKHDKVRSISNCNACHTTAAKGRFGERDINIPGHGKWED